jgi:hypothetical protein
LINKTFSTLNNVHSEGTNKSGYEQLQQTATLFNDLVGEREQLSGTVRLSAFDSTIP